MPAGNGAARPDLAEACRVGIAHPSGICFSEEVEEFTVLTNAFDQAITILHFGDEGSSWSVVEEHEPDVVDRFERNGQA